MVLTLFSLIFGFVRTDIALWANVSVIKFSSMLSFVLLMFATSTHAALPFKVSVRMRVSLLSLNGTCSFLFDVAFDRALMTFPRVEIDLLICDERRRCETIWVG